MVKYSKNKFGTETQYKLIFQWWIEFQTNAIDPVTGQNYPLEYYTPQSLNDSGVLPNTKISSSKLIEVILNKAALLTKLARIRDPITGLLYRRFPQIKKISIRPLERKYFKRGRNLPLYEKEATFHKAIEMKIITNGTLPGVRVFSRQADGSPYSIPVYYLGSQLETIFNYFKKIIKEFPIQMNDDPMQFQPTGNLGDGIGRIDCILLIAQTTDGGDVTNLN